MRDLPELTLCVVGCRRPWYYALSLTAIIGRVFYDGPKRFVLSDGGSPPHEIEKMQEILAPHNHEIVITDNLSAMWNACAHHSGEVWMVTLDDFIPRQDIDVTQDVRFLLENEDVGAIRMGRLAFWEHDGNDRIVADLRMLGGMHWWVIRKHPESQHPYVSCINTFLYHRRYWDCYGDLPDVPPDIPGDAELMAARMFNIKEGPRIAIPMRFGEDGGRYHSEPIWQLPSWRTDAYAASGGGRRM